MVEDRRSASRRPAGEMSQAARNRYVQSLEAGATNLMVARCHSRAAPLSPQYFLEKVTCTKAGEARSRMSGKRLFASKYTCTGPLLRCIRDAFCTRTDRLLPDVENPDTAGMLRAWTSDRPDLQQLLRRQHKHLDRKRRHAVMHDARGPDRALDRHNAARIGDGVRLRAIAAAQGPHRSRPAAS